MKICYYIFKNTILKTLVFIAFYFTSFFSFSQTTAIDLTVPPEKGYRCRAEIVNGDTIPVVDLFTVDVITDFIFKNPCQYELWTRTKYNVKIVYPYAILAAAKLKEYDKVLGTITDEKQKKAYLRLCEKDLRHEFEDELKALTVSQGKVLMKLIDRETGKTTYEIVKQMRGSFQAYFWQALASLFGNSMKVNYNAEEDIMIERAVKLVETGRF